jgi:predicted nicotinamide N-methyase
VTPDRARRLVQDRTRLARPPAVPELELHLADDMERAWADLQTELDDATLPPPFWAFAWLGGQAVARHVLDTPAEVAGLRVLDLATGSGLCALAARTAGAAHVEGVDVDPVAVEAARLNAVHNGLEVDLAVRDVLDAPPPDVDVVLAGDVFYDAAMAERVQPWLLAAHRRGVRVLLGDPGRHYLPRALLTELAAYELATTRELEGVLVRTTRVYAFGS